MDKNLKSRLKEIEKLENNKLNIVENENKNIKKVTIWGFFKSLINVILEFFKYN